uniref:Uncharacterized protein n=1 Tax=Kalanchoe fedtschenkoi TaxID=63787 RepID=A0A7N0V1P9_KALFE
MTFIHLPRNYSVLVFILPCNIKKYSCFIHLILTPSKFLSTSLVSGVAPTSNFFLQCKFDTKYTFRGPLSPLMFQTPIFKLSI